MISSGTSWETKFGYSRAIRIGNQVFVAGTTAIDENGKTVGSDPYTQAVYIFKKIEKALTEAGACLADIVRIRTFVTDIERWEQVGKAQGECLGHIRPAATLVQVSALVEPQLLVEIEADAIIQG